MSRLVESYIEQSNHLFKEWKGKTISGDIELSKDHLVIDHRNSVFIKDGVVCPKKWFSNNIRPLYLLKEAYGGDKDWDLIKEWLLSDNQMTKMWNRVAQWTVGLMSTTSTTINPYSKYKSGTFVENEILSNIAVINIKKSKGTKNSNWEEIEKYAEYDRIELLQEIEICDPTIIVCGYTSKPLEIILGNNFRKEWNQNCFYHVALNNHDVLVIDYWHPANQYPDIMNYYTLMNIYQLALKGK